MRIGYVCGISLEEVEMKNLQYVHNVAPTYDDYGGSLSKVYNDGEISTCG